MPDKIYTNRYIAEYVKSDLKWYERDGLLTYIDQLKCSNFIEDSGKHIARSDIINVDIIYKKCGLYKAQENSEKHHQTVPMQHVEKLPEKDKKRAVVACLCLKEGMFLLRNLIICLILANN